LLIGRSLDGSVGLSLADGNGKARIRLTVETDGKSGLQFLDENGKIVSEFPGQKK